MSLPKYLLFKYLRFDRTQPFITLSAVLAFLGVSKAQSRTSTAGRPCRSERAEHIAKRCEATETLILRAIAAPVICLFYFNKLIFSRALQI